MVWVSLWNHFRIILAVGFILKSFGGHVGIILGFSGVRMLLESGVGGPHAAGIWGNPPPKLPISHMLIGAGIWGNLPSKLLISYIPIGIPRDNGISFRVNAFGCNTKMVLHPESLLLNVIPQWHYIKKHCF